MVAAEGEVVDVVDADDVPRCRVRMIAVYETTFGLPAPGVVAGEGFDDAEAFRKDHHAAWAEEMEEEGNPLSDDTVLVVEEFELVEVVEG